MGSALRPRLGKVEFVHVFSLASGLLEYGAGLSTRTFCDDSCSGRAACTSSSVWKRISIPSVCFLGWAMRVLRGDSPGDLRHVTGGTRGPILFCRTALLTFL